MGFIRHVFFFLCLPACLSLICLWILVRLEDYFLQEDYVLYYYWGDAPAAWSILFVLAMSISYLIAQAFERARARKLATLAKSMGMQFDANLSWYAYITRTSKYVGLQQSSVPSLQRCSSFRNIFVVGAEPVIFGCVFTKGFGQSSYDTYRTVYRHKGEVATSEENKAVTDWEIEVGDGFTIYFKKKFRTSPNAIKEEYRETLELHKTLRR